MYCKLRESFFMKKRIAIQSIESLLKNYLIYNHLQILRENESANANIEQIQKISEELNSINEEAFKSTRNSGEFDLMDKGNHYNMF